MVLEVGHRYLVDDKRFGKTGETYSLEDYLIRAKTPDGNFYLIRDMLDDGDNSEWVSAAYLNAYYEVDFDSGLGPR